uniref:BED-type domain-containing protein n=1 Tax=Peronospora matthiolae TaxID=2874970 RepID=A0AAV1UNT2_9STRA
MGRKPSNVYDYFVRLEPEADHKGLVRYQCKKCDKQYASNATRLAEHLKMSCVPGFQTNQRIRKAADSLLPAGPVQSPQEFREAPDATESAIKEMEEAVGPLPPLSVPRPDPLVAPGVETAQSLALRRSDHQLLTNMLESESEPPQDSTEVLLRLAKLSTCAIGDAMAQLKLQGYCLVDVNLVRGYDTPLAMNICGPAFTVEVMPLTSSCISSGFSSNYMDAVETSQVVVISAPERSPTAVFGRVLATASRARNVAGVVTNGRVRQVRELCSLNFPAFATGTAVQGEYGATTVTRVNRTILVAGCVVRPNDIIRGDVNGVVVIPVDRAQDIATRAEVLEDQDNKLLDALKNGEPLHRLPHCCRTSRDV